MERQLKDTTIKNYNQQFNKFFKLLNKTNDYLINNSDDVIKFIAKTYPNIGTQKTILSSLLYELRDIKYDYFKNKNEAINNYKTIINNIAIQIKNNLSTNEKTLKQSENWDSWDNIVSIFNQKFDEIKFDLKHPNKLSYEKYNKIQTVIILSFYIYHPPRRSEYRLIKLYNYNIDDDNYIIPNDKIILNSYKTSDKKGEFNINLKQNKKLNVILNDFIRLRTINNFKSDYLFVSDNDKLLDHSQLTKRINKLFDKNISISMLRKIYLSHHFGNKDNIDFTKKYLKAVNEMGTSITSSIQNYIKK